MGGIKGFENPQARFFDGRCPEYTVLRNLKFAEADVRAVDRRRPRRERALDRARATPFGLILRFYSLAGRPKRARG